MSVLEIFLVMQVTREEARLVTSKAMTTCNLTSLANAVVEIPPLITADVIRLMFTIPVIVLNRFCFFFAFCSQTSISPKKYASISLNLFNKYACGSCGA